MPNDLFEAGGAGETKLRVAMFVHRFPLVSETFVINQVVGLMRLGHEVDIYSFGAQPPNAALTQPDVAQYRLLERTKYPPASPRDGLRFLRCGVRQAATLLRSQPKALARSLDLVSHRREALLLRLLSMAWLLRDRKTYDVVHCQFGTVGRMVLPLLECGLLNGALVVAFRGSDISQYLKQRGERIYDGLLRRGDYFFTNCYYFQRRLMALGCDPQRLEALYSGIDFNKFRFSFRQRRLDGPVHLITVGRLVEKKGIAFAIRAVAQLLQDGYAVEYIIVGEGELRAQLEALVAELKVAHVVRLLGAKAHGEIVELLKQADIFLGPSVTASTGDEDAMPNSHKEAMAMGVPVVATRHGGIPDLVRHNVSGYLVPERDARAIAECLKHLINHPDAAHEIVTEAREQVEREFDLARLNHQLVEIYRKAIRHRLKRIKEST